MKKIREEQKFKPTLDKPMSTQSKNFDSNFKKTMIRVVPNVNLNEVDGMLSEAEQSLKKKIFNLAKMEALVFSDPKLLAVYEEMAENGEEKYGYHYNETIQNMIFNDYVLNSPKYLQKYKMAIPKEKKRRDKSGINQLKKTAGGTKMGQSGLPKNQKTVDESNEPLTKVMFLVNENDPENPDVFAYFPEEIHNGEYKTAYSHMGQHSAVHPQYAEESRPATPEEYVDLKAELENIGYNLEVLNAQNESTGASSSGAFAPAMGYKNVDETTTSASSGAYVGPAAWSSKGDLMGDKGKPIKKPMWPGGKIIQETQYLTDPSGFEKFINELNEQIDIENPQLAQKPNTTPHGNKEVSDKIINNSSAFNSDAVKNWNKSDAELELNTLTSKKFDTPNIKEGSGMNENLVNYYQNMQPKDAVNKASIEYKSALKNNNQSLANKISGNLKSHLESVGYNWKQDPYALEILGDFINEKAKSKSQQRFMGMVHAIHKGDLSPDEVGDDVAKAAAGMSNSDAEDFASTKHKGLPEKIDETNEDLVEFDIPEWALSALVNGDESGLEDEDITKLNSFVSNVSSNYGNANFILGNIDGEDNLGFRNGNDIDNLGDNVYRLYIRPSKNSMQETDQTMIAKSSSGTMTNYAQPSTEQGGNVPTGTQQMGGNISENKINKDMALLEELNKELEAYSIHQEKLMKMTEDRKPSALVLRDRVGSENEANFKKDMSQSDTKQIIDVQKELEWKDQQTEIGNDPQKLGQDIEKDVEDEAFENVGDSTNEKGNEIPKRNLTSDEQEEVNMYRLGQHSLVYDNEPSKRFEERMKKDMGDDIYKMRQKQMEFRSKAPMYNKDTQPIETGIDKSQFNKEESGWNEREGLKESMITGRYIDALGKRRIIDFTLGEVKLTESPENYYELDFTGLGNAYLSKSVDNKVIVNEGVVNVMGSHKFYTNGKNIIAVKNQVQNLTESELKNQKPVVNEQIDKMKHLLGYKPKEFVNTTNVKKNRGF